MKLILGLASMVALSGFGASEDGVVADDREELVGILSQYDVQVGSARRLSAGSIAIPDSLFDYKIRLVERGGHQFQDPAGTRYPYGSGSRCAGHSSGDKSGAGGRIPHRVEAAGTARKG